ncbi:MAG: hypothetical protein B7Z36_03485 [Novosphingobium sp. 12-63-9]|nr:MAG: hypothetical protein B7Z36_03485 [Novosphingobium sp. 12-63-9]
MGQEYTAKSFKSGNSVAIRVPAALGVEPDREWSIEWVDGNLVLRAKLQVKPKLDVSKFWGKAKGLKVPERSDFDERPSTIAAREGNVSR